MKLFSVLFLILVFSGCGGVPDSSTNGQGDAPETPGDSTRVSAAEDKDEDKKDKAHVDSDDPSLKSVISDDESQSDEDSENSIAVAQAEPVAELDSMEQQEVHVPEDQIDPTENELIALTDDKSEPVQTETDVGLLVNLDDNTDAATEQDSSVDTLVLLSKEGEKDQDESGESEEILSSVVEETAPTVVETDEKPVSDAQNVSEADSREDSSPKEEESEKQEVDSTSKTEVVESSEIVASSEVIESSEIVASSEVVESSEIIEPVKKESTASEGVNVVDDGSQQEESSVVDVAQAEEIPQASAADSEDEFFLAGWYNSGTEWFSEIANDFTLWLFEPVFAQEIPEVVETDSTVELSSEEQAIQLITQLTGALAELRQFVQDNNISGMDEFMFHVNDISEKDSIERTDVEQKGINLKDRLINIANEISLFAEQSEDIQDVAGFLEFVEYDNGHLPPSRSDLENMIVYFGSFSTDYNESAESSTVDDGTWSAKPDATGPY